MKAHDLTSNFRRLLPLVAAATAMILSACSSNSSNAGAPAAAAKSAEKKPARDTAKEPGATEPARSVFTVDDSSRDPFYPKKKKAVAEVEPARAVAQVDVFSLLQEGFQGTMSSGDQRIALINNVIVEAGRQSQIPIGAGPQARTITVLCREIDRDSVLLEVQGYSQPVRVVRVASNF